MPTLNWLGKEAVVEHHKQVPFHLLKYNSKLSVGDADSGNLLIEGDNLLALKALLPYYAGQVKCIYIDPPYNTGNENWVYNDNVNAPQIREWLGKVVGGEGEDLSRHDKWLCMMYPRLQLLHQLLREDGVIFISIDDNEVAQLRLIADEIFGATNFLGNVVWQKKQSPQNDAINLSDMHDHILVYAKRAKQNRNAPNGWQRNLVPRNAKDDRRRFTNPDNDPRGDWVSADITVNKTAEERPNLYYSVINPITRKVVWPTKRRAWLFEKLVYEKLISENRIWWGADGKNFPRLKKFRSDAREGIVPSTWWDREFAGDNQESRRELRALFPDWEEDVFATPKPVHLIERILQIATDKNSLVLDSFAGSGTTAHAVLQANKADDGNRRFILVEMESNIAQNITAERLRRVIQGYTWKDQQGKQHREEGLGGGFSYCELGATLFDADGQIRHEVKFDELARHVFFVETGEPLPKRANGRTPFLGVARGVGVYLLYNGVLRDKSRDGGNVLTSEILSALPKHDGPKVIYGTGCRIGAARLKRAGITFRQIPYEVKVA
jgi:site-specific DNA-methyltransferase (adenine-specific)/adenine-specific DNA-methyltransferase